MNNPKGANPDISIRAERPEDRSAGRGGRIAFHGRLYSIGQLRCVDVPAAKVRALGGPGRIPVRVWIGPASGQSSLVPKRDGGHRLYIDRMVRKAALIESGDRVRIELARDARGGEPDLPPELIEALGRIKGGLSELYSRSPADRRQLTRWIEAPKSRDARMHRIGKAVGMVMRGKPRRPHRRKA